jgi:hypothetical protein
MKLETKRNVKDEVLFNFNRIITIIDSCISFEQLHSCLNIVLNHKKRFGLEANTDPLLARIDNRRREIYSDRLELIQKG